MRTLSPREHRLIAIAILLGLVAVAWLGIVSPLLGGFLERADQRATLETDYARNARIIDSIRIWKHQALAQERDAARYALVAPNAALAVQLLQSRVVGTVKAVGGTVTGSRPQETTTAGTVRVGADAELTLAQLVECLKRLENGEPYVVVEYFSVGADRAFQTGHLAPMAVRLRLSASYRPARPQ